MSAVPYIALFAVVAIGVVEAVAFLVMKDDRLPNARRAQPE
jgi:hypothetical protein